MFKYLFLLILLIPNTVWAEVNIPPGSDRYFPPPATPMSLGEKPHHLSAEACRDCHREIYDQWKNSMHAKSTALKSPIHAALYHSEVGNPREEGTKHKASGSYPMCLKCHAPNAARDKKTKLDAIPAYSEGVNCLTCHTIKGYKGVMPDEPDGKLKLGIDAYEMSDILQAPSGKVFSPVAQVTPPGLASPSFHPFPMESNTAILRTSQLCLGCHERRNNPNGVPLCNTGEEFSSSGNFNCQQCHMPVTNGFADHTMPGGHVQPMVERGVIMLLHTQKEGDEILAQVELQNMLPHNMPTGAPFRNLFLKITAYNAMGQPLWQNAQQHPIRDDPQAMLMLRLLDDNDKPAPPPKATKQGEDSRLRPGEIRTLRYRIPQYSVAVVRAELYYDLLLPALKQRFMEIPHELKQPRIIAHAEKLIYQ